MRTPIVSIDPLVDSHISCENGVVIASPQNSHDGGNLPAIISSIVDSNLVNILLSDAAILKLKRSDVIAPQVSLVFQHVIARSVIQTNVSILMSVEVNENVRAITRTSVFRSTGKCNQIKDAVTTSICRKQFTRLLYECRCQWISLPVACC